MEKSALRKTAVAAAMAGMFASSGPADAEVVNFNWSGAFTFLNAAGDPFRNLGSDYEQGYLANGGPGYGPGTAEGWYGYRTPISGTLAFDISTGAGVASINPFYFLGDTPGEGPGTSVAHVSDFTLALIDPGDIYAGAFMFSWNGAGHSVSIVMDFSGLIDSLPTTAPGTVIYGVGALPATDALVFGDPVNGALPLGPVPGATTTRNALGCEGQLLATQVSPSSIVHTGNVGNCDLSQDDGIGGSPMVSANFSQHNMNIDFYEIEYLGASVPLPPTAWLFGSGLLGLIGLARRRKQG